MRSKILTGAAVFALVTTAGLATTAPASARHMLMPFWGTGYYGYPGSYYPGYAYGPYYTYAPGYGYGYRRYGRYRGYYGGYGSHPRCFQTCPDRTG
jgi:hypothetical protein